MPRTHPDPPRSALIVGGTSGIGLALAERLAARGVVLTLAARHEGRLEEAASLLAERHGASVATVSADLGDADAVRDAVRTAVDHGRAAGLATPLDAVVTTAQAMAYGTVEALPAEVLDASLRTAAVGTGLLAGEVLPVFRKQGGGHLLVVGSLLSQIAVPGMSGYCAAKAAQLMLVRALQMEVRGERGVAVSMVSPGAVDTPIYRRAGRYSGPQGVAPPPVVSADRVAAACERALVRPVRNRQVGPVNLPAIAGYRAAPLVYDVLAPLLVRGVVRRGARGPDTPGNVLAPTPGTARTGDGWRWWGGRRSGGS